MKQILSDIGQPMSNWQSRTVILKRKETNEIRATIIPVFCLEAISELYMVKRRETKQSPVLLWG